MIDTEMRQHLQALVWILMLALAVVACGDPVRRKMPIHEGLVVQVGEHTWSHQLGSQSAGEDYIFISLYILGHNNGKEVKTFNPLDFRLVDGSGDKYGARFKASKDPAFSFCRVGPGETCRGWWTARVPDRSDVRGDLRLQWHPDWPTEPLFELVAVGSERQSADESESCQLWKRDRVHVREHTRPWTRPDVTKGKYQSELDKGSAVYIIRGPMWGRIRQDQNRSGWWWEISKTRNGESVGWIWEGRIEECGYNLN